MIFNFDEVEALENLKEDINNIKLLLNAKSENYNTFRNFYIELGINLNVGNKLIDRIENSLIIDLYTYSERLLKYTVYQVLGYESQENSHLNNFIRKKINEDRFSPNPTFDKFEQELSSLNPEFKFFIKKVHNRPEIESYNQMIVARHQYAHANRYPEEMETLMESIHIIEYLAWECQRFIGYSEKDKQFCEDYDKLNKQFKSVKSIVKSDKRSPDRLISESENLKEKVEELSSIAYGLANTDYFGNVDALKEIKVYIERLKNIDIDRYTVSDLTELLNSLNKEFSE